MLKLARRHHHERGDADRVELVAAHRSFHGRTYGSLSVTGQPKYHVGMGPMVPGVRFVDYNDLDALRARVNEKTAAVILEPVQGEGGVVAGDDAYLRGVRELCDARGALFLLDEIQTGYGRTGRFLAQEWSGVVPDACSVAKGIGGGFPLGAMLVTDALAGSLPPGSHGTTFGGNPLACAAGLAVLRIFDEERLVERVAETGERLRDGLARLASDVSIPSVVEVRGRGLLLGLRVAEGVDPAAIVAAARGRGLLLTLAGADVIRLTPPLVVRADEVDEALATLRAAIGGAGPPP
jgi:acetylornithine/succinyldiaminopimelate/putrescine aminotransferase